MTNEQAIKHLEDLQRLYLGNEKFTADIEAIEIAINALNNHRKEKCEYYNSGRCMGQKWAPFVSCKGDHNNCDVQ